MNRFCSEKDHTLKAAAKTIRDERERYGFGDQYMELQQVSMPKIDHMLVSKKIEMLFEMIDPNGEHILQCCAGDAIAASK
eukprot:5764818-Ditylum_brightwellii.AAC.1